MVPTSQIIALCLMGLARFTTAFSKCNCFAGEKDQPIEELNMNWEAVFHAACTQFSNWPYTAREGTQTYQQHRLCYFNQWQTSGTNYNDYMDLKITLYDPAPISLAKDDCVKELKALKTSCNKGGWIPLDTGWGFTIASKRFSGQHVYPADRGACLDNARSYYKADKSIIY